MITRFSRINNSIAQALQRPSLEKMIYGTMRTRQNVPRSNSTKAELIDDLEARHSIYSSLTPPRQFFSAASMEALSVLGAPGDMNPPPALKGRARSPVAGLPKT